VLPGSLVVGEPVELAPVVALVIEPTVTPVDSSPGSAGQAGQAVSASSSAENRVEARGSGVRVETGMG